MHRERRQVEYTADEVGDLIRLASRLDALSDRDGLDYEQVSAVADELGISKESLAVAVRQRRRLGRAEARAAARTVRRRMRFIRHSMVYAVVMAALLVVDAAGGGGWWFFYPAALWGVFLTLHALRFFTGRRGPVERYVSNRVLRSAGYQP
jgi:hypothetical protein